MDTLRQDLRYALRQIARAPFFTAVAVAVLAIGIGANSALFSILRELIARPAPGIENSPQILRLLPIVTSPERGRRLMMSGVLSYEQVRAFQALDGTFESVAAWTRNAASLEVEELEIDGSVQFVTREYFRVLGVQTAIGATLPAGDDAVPETNAVAVASHGFWKRHLGGAAGVVGRRVLVNGVPFTIVGVTEPRFSGVRHHAEPLDLWVPLGTAPAVLGEAGADLLRQESALGAVARLRSGVSLPSATAAASALASNLESSVRLRTGERLDVDLLRLRGSFLQGAESRAVAFAGTALGLFILLLTCTNIANLMLGRAVARRQEIAVRLSLGASRLRVVRQLLTESIIVAMIASACGLVLLGWIAAWLESLGTHVPVALAPDAAAVAFTAAFAIGTGILFGLVPALHATRATVADALKDGAAGLDRRRSRLQGGFVVAQLALSVPVLAGCAVILGVLVEVGTSPAGYDDRSDRVITGELRLVGPRDASLQLMAMLPLLEERLGALPGVQRVGFMTGLPPDGGGAFPVRLRAPDADGDSVSGFVEYIDETYLPTLGLRLVRGRGIGAGDIAGAPRVALVSEDVAAAFPGGDAIGRSIAVGRMRDSNDTYATIVGIVAPIRPVDRGREAPAIYLARRQHTRLAWRLLIRTGSDADAVAQSIRVALREFDPRLTVRRLETLAQANARMTGDMRRAVATAFGAAGVALFLACIGVYAIIAFGVAQRTREIGIRKALGAADLQVLALFLRQGVVLTIMGLVIGLPITVIGLSITPETSGRLSLENAIAIGVMAAFLIGVAALASWLPARRAALVDPVEALRAE